MRILRVLLYILMLVIFVTGVFADEMHDIPAIEKPLPYHGTTPRKAAISLFSIDPDAVDISNQIYSNIVKFTPEFYIQNDLGLTELNPWDNMTQTELETVKSWAADITSGCTTTDQKIYAIMEYVAKNVYYDMDFYNNYDGDSDEYETLLNHNAYDVLTNKTAVCYGYAATASALLQISSVPCVIVHSPNHAWNMAYNGERWVFFDTTWISSNELKNGILHTDLNLNLEWFDFTLEKANSDCNHLFTGADYCEYNNTIYEVPIHTSTGRFEIPNNITAIEEFTFYGADSIIITGDLRNISTVGRSAFYNCRLFDGVINLKNATYIDQFAFYGCSGIDGITSLENADYVGKAAFYDCSSIDGIVDIGKLCTVEDYAFINCRNLDGVKGIEDVTYIGYGAFSGCVQLSDAFDLQAIETIGQFAFNGTALSRVYILNDNVNIGEYAFQGCPAVIYAHDNSASYAYATYYRIPFGDIDLLTFTITYNSNGGTVVPDATVKKYGETVKIAESLPQKGKSEFIAWSTSADGQADYLPGDEYSENKDIVLYALWNDEPSITYGDVQGDGKVDVSDVIYILQVLASGTGHGSSEIAKKAADVNCDGNVDVSDVIRILQHLASPTTQLGPQ